MKEYNVWVSFQGAYCVTVEADNRADAIDRAIEVADPFNVIDWDLDAEVMDDDF